MSKRFVATEDTTVATIVEKLGDSAAVAEGRAFLGRHRVVRGDEAVRAGQELLVHATREEVLLPEPFVLHHDGGLLIVDKPAGVPTIPDTIGASGTLIDLAARAISVSRDRLHPTSRLDREVSGVVTFALDEGARDALARAARYERRYVAIAAGTPAAGPWQWPIGRARDPRLRRAAPDGKPAESRVRVVRQVGRFALLALSPVTGRTHQLRVHASAAGAPLVGDRAYGGPPRLTLSNGKSVTVGRVALHCARVRIDANGCIIQATSPVSPELMGLARELGLGDFEEAIACEL
jgi:23S rRNA-/tRNA-specific pseudouridylate synthase